jgi:transcriptional regulator with XRE-family HTH domain
MAERTGLSVASIAALRTGSRGKRPQPHTLKKLAAAMGYDETELALAVDASADDRRREQRLLRRFRDLSDEHKDEVERLVARLSMHPADGTG